MFLLLQSIWFSVMNTRVIISFLLALCGITACSGDYLERSLAVPWDYPFERECRPGEVFSYEDFALEQGYDFLQNHL